MTQPPVAPSTDASEQQNWITPREAIDRLGNAESDFSYLHDIVTRLGATAMQGDTRVIGYAIDDVPQAGPEAASAMDAFALDTFKMHFASATHHLLGTWVEKPRKLEAEFGDYSIVRGNFTIQSAYALTGFDEEGEEVVRTENWIVQYTDLRFLETAFTAAFPQATKTTPMRKGQRGGMSKDQVSMPEIHRWIAQCGTENSATAWDLFYRHHGARACTKPVFTIAWKEAKPDRKRGRPRKDR